MNKAIICVIFLTACGGESNEKNSSIPKEQIPFNLYSIDGFTGEYDINELLLFSAMYVNPKTYSFDANKKLYISYQNLPIFKTEVLKQIITPTKIFSTKSQHIKSYNYLIGEQANFDGQKLKYTLNDASSSEMLTLSWEYKKIDVSGKPIIDDLNNPIHRMKKSVNSEIVASVYGVGYTDSDVFPQGAVCWQKKLAQSNQEYIDYYPERIIRHVGEEREILRTGQWNNADWIEFQSDDSDLELANVKLEIDGKVYWGFYHIIYENFILKPDQLSCDFMNEIAYKAAIPKLDKFNQQFKLENGGMDIGQIWQPLYLDKSELNPSLPEIETE